jgi:TRAP-type C4-dicarboxylate transport system permease small subunit
MQVIRNYIDKFTEVLSSCILALMTVLVTWQVITRFVLKNPSTITEALAKYLFLWLVLITSAYVIGKREHMAIEFFVNRFSKKTQIVLGIITEIVILLFVAIVLTYGGGFIATNAMTQMDSALPVPVGVIYMALPVSGILSVFYSLCNILDFMKQYKEEI